MHINAAAANAATYSISNITIIVTCHAGGGAEGKVIYEYHDVVINDLEGGSRRCAPVEHSKF
jgi:hypothetical protein